MRTAVTEISARVNTAYYGSDGYNSIPSKKINLDFTTIKQKADNCKWTAPNHLVKESDLYNTLFCLTLTLLKMEIHHI